MDIQDLREFASGTEYDAQYDQLYEAAVDFIRSQIELTQARSLLDICCGTGIVTIPLAKHLDDVIGIDIADSMLEHARNKALQLDNLAFINQNACRFALHRQFDIAVMTGNSVQAFLDDEMLESVLASIALHLKQGARFIFDARMPTAYNLELDSDMALWQSYSLPEVGEVEYFGMSDKYDSDKGILYYRIKRCYPDGSVKHSGIDLKFRTLDEYTTSLHRAGFQIIEKYSSWTANLYTEESDNLICIAEKL
ncbi:class I SAM-dependent methyltransferase [Vibrio sp. CAU 1672]|uniref:class I SAM-dependent methyltransferase n=1 Tax=Vibrio sp. CAU 1672 TaxID=3032594 RepID=UPI0023DAB7B4|nr:class I SAM-dependent methyltransferase [Vibrio sp. CAU 1672]MDF2154246.1 class I SAM-dependent methyltransferase [Vibrio sp. CAU 1672]